MTPEGLAHTIQNATQPGFRGGLLAKGQARAMIWRDGILPQGAPNFPVGLSFDLYSYGYTLLLMALRLRDQGGDEVLVRSAFEHAGDALESVVDRGSPDDAARGFHRLLAAAAFHLGRYSARAFSLLNISLGQENLSLIETALARLILRSLDDVDQSVIDWLSQGAGADDALVAGLEEYAKAEDKANEGQDTADALLEALDHALTDNYLRGMATFVFALESGAKELLQSALGMLREGLAVAGEVNLVPQWWCHKLTLYLLDDLWAASFHAVLPPDVAGADGQKWAELRALLIAVLTKRRRAEIELWPSQIEAATRVVDANDSLILSLPTSAGKTRIAELCILRCLAAGKRAVYVTPLRALSAQTESEL